ncbi:MAG TPA: AAA family ATPase [Bacillota bacterium]|nr:AAA family ATPase [Bacillota bacterium]
MKYVSLALEGFGCFKERTVFEFAGGVDTLYRLNESGKSTMVNGLVHTVYGLRKQGKDRFRSWRGAPSFKGGLTFTSKGMTYRIDMDFAADRVAVGRFDPDTGRFVSLIREQSHVPAGKRSQKYEDFVQEHFGTIDVDAFRSAFVLEQPNENVAGLGEGWRLLAEKTGGDYRGARDRLLSRLGRDMSDGITMRLRQYGESRDLLEKRQLEQLEDAIDEDAAKLRRAREDLDRIAPLNERLQEKLQDAEDARLNKGMWTERKMSVTAWMDVRERWVAKNEEYARKKADLEQIVRKEKERDERISELAGLRSGHEGPGMPPSRLDAIKETFYEVKEAVEKAEAIKAGHKRQEGLSAELLDADLTIEGAEQRLRDIYGRACEAGRALDEAVRADEVWKGRFKEVMDLTEEDRKKMGEEATRTAAGSAKDGEGLFIKLSPLFGILAGFAISFLALRRPSDRTAMVLTVVLCSVLGFVLKAYLGRRRAAKRVGGALEADGLAGRIRLYDEMKAAGRPLLPDDAAAARKRLSDVMRDADSLSRLALIAARAIGRVTEKDAAEVGAIAGYDVELGVRGLLVKDGSFWSEVARKNNMRNERQKLIDAKAAEVDTDGKVIEGLIKARGSDTGALAADAEATRQQAAAIMSEWELKFSRCTYLKVSIDKEAFLDAERQMRRAEDYEREYDSVINSRTQEAERLSGELREARSRDIDNIPELEEKLSYEEGRKKALKREERAIALAVQELDAANAKFSSSALGAMKMSVTNLLGTITGDRGRVVEVGEDLKLLISSDGTAVSYEQLSQGTKDQLNVCVRVAAAELLGESRRIPMFFDDSFGTTDEARLGRIRELLVEMSKTRQFIVLSHSREIEGWGKSVIIK